MLSDLINPSDIKLDLISTEKEECFAELLEMHVAKHPEINRSQVLDALIEREDKGSTAVFSGIAVPHCVCPSLKKTSVVIGLSREGIEFEPLDESSNKNPIVNVIFEILFAEHESEVHLYVLKDILQIVHQPDFLSKIFQNKNYSIQEIYDIISSFEK